MRRSSGSWKSELDELAELCTGAFVVGVSGGATLGVGLLERDIPVLGAVLHEPAAGTLAPNLLDAVVAAMATGGPAAFGPALYGPSWSPELLSDDPDAVARDLAMFRGFEPKPAAEALPHVVITVGERSPAIRHQSVAAVAAVIGARTAVVPGASHAVHLDSVDNFAELIVTELDTADAPPRTVGAARAHLRKEGN
jgi:pimeloyl-ACP methyl ester carboxylesterase